MNQSVAAIDEFFEYAPGQWLLVGWSTSSDLEAVFLAPLLGEKLRFPILPVRLPRPDVAADLDDQSPDCGFAAFISHPVVSMVASVEIADHTLQYHPTTLNQVDCQWFSQLSRIFSLLHLPSLSSQTVELLLQSGLKDCIRHAETYWSLQVPWERQSFQRFSFGTDLHRSELTLLLVPNALEHEQLVDYVQALCSEDLFLTSACSLLVVVDQSCCPSVLKSKLQQMLDLQRIRLELVVADCEIGLSQCINLGVYLSSSDSVALAPCLSTPSPSNVFNTLYHSSVLEPQHLIISSLDAGRNRCVEPMVFNRESFFALGALGSVGFSFSSVVQLLIRTFGLTPGYGIRRVFDLFEKDVLIRSDPLTLDACSILEPWQSVIEEILFEG